MKKKGDRPITPKPRPVRKERRNKKTGNTSEGGPAQGK